MMGPKSGVMSHNPAHCRSMRMFAIDGISSRTWLANPVANSSDPRVEYEANGSTLAPNTSSPRAVWLTYVWRLPDTTTGWRNFFTGSVTAAWSGRVVIGSLTPAMAAIRDAQPAVQLMIVGVEISPRLVLADRTRPSSTWMPVSSVS